MTFFICFSACFFAVACFETLLACIKLAIIQKKQKQVIKNNVKKF